MTDARFEDGTENPVRLVAHTDSDLPVLSALCQDALIQSENISWMKSHQRVAMLMSRFRWEDREKAAVSGRAFERVQSMLIIEGVRAMRAQGVYPNAKDLILSLLSMAFAAGDDGSGSITIALSGDGALAMDVEYLEVRLQDVTRPYRAVSQMAPDHKIER